ncbi:ABC transporter permease, partial [Pseudomonas syringae pv. actinidiae ICMP 19096]
MLLSLEPRGQQSRAMLWCSPLLAAPVSDLYGLSELMVKTLPILLCALGLAVAYQARIWNIGAEGQLLLGALAGSAVAVNIIEMESRWALV